MALTLQQQLDKFPPALCRLVARKHRGRRPLTRREIASRSGLSLRQVDYLSKRTTWGGTTVKAMCAFATACGVDLLHPRRHVDWLRRRPKSAWLEYPEVARRGLTLILSANRQSSP